MGDKPCPVLPVPKTTDLQPGASPWPRRIDVTARGSLAASFADRFRGVLSGPGELPMQLVLVDAEAKPGGYKLDLTAGLITVSAADAPGFRHALQTLRQLASEPFMPLGVITDWPDLRLRGFHLNLESYRRMNAHQATAFIETAARFKLNAVLVEYGPRFPFERCPWLRDDLALTFDEIEQLSAAAREHGVELIPLQQSLAHLEYALRHEPLRELRENPDRPNLMCPCHPGSLELFKKLAAEVLARHDHATHFHLGGDEARKVGRCDRCRAALRDGAIGDLYGRYIGEAARWLLDQGVRPIVWDDTLCAYPDAFQHLPKELIIDYWDYIAVADPTPILIPRMAHLEGAPRVAHDWSWTLPNRRGRLAPVQAKVMRDYSSPCRLKSALGRRYMQEYGPYLGDAFPRWIRALPYLEYYQARGHDTVTSPTGMGNGDTADGIPNFERFDHNIQTHARRCKANARALGLITTAWYNMPPELLYQPLLRTAQCVW